VTRFGNSVTRLYGFELPLFRNITTTTPGKRRRTKKAFFKKALQEEAWLIAK